jgi:hypothetical protein
MQKSFWFWRRLVQLARFLRCADLDAAMHNRNRGTCGANDSILEYDSADAIAAVLRHCFELPCSPKNK